MAASRLCQRKREPEGRAATERALDADAASVSLDDRAADMQSQAQSYPRFALHLDTLHAMETFPDALVLAGWQARAVIRHCDACLAGADIHLHIDICVGR